MRTSDEIYHRVRWDPRFDPGRFVLGISQRGMPSNASRCLPSCPGDIPRHRVVFIEADGEVVWDLGHGCGPRRRVGRRPGAGPASGPDFRHELRQARAPAGVLDASPTARTAAGSRPRSCGRRSRTSAGTTIRRSTAGRRTSMCSSASCRSPTSSGRPRCSPRRRPRRRSSPPDWTGCAPSRHRAYFTVLELSPDGGRQGAVGRPAPRAAAAVPALSWALRRTSPHSCPGRTRIVVRHRRLRYPVRRHDGDSLGPRPALMQGRMGRMRPRATGRLRTGEVRRAAPARPRGVGPGGHGLLRDHRQVRHIAR